MATIKMVKFLLKPLHKQHDFKQKCYIYLLGMVFQRCKLIVFLGVVNMIDDSSRSDDSNLEKPVTPNVPNDDSDSQASSNKR